MRKVKTYRKVLVNDPFTKSMYYAYLTPTGRSLRLYSSGSESQKLQELRLLREGIDFLKKKL